MSTAQIIAELAKLKPQERAEVFERLSELRESDLIAGLDGPTDEERRLLDEALAAFDRDGDPGIPWREAIRRIRAAGRA